MRRILLAGLVLFILAALSLSTLSLPSLSAAPRVRPPRGPLAKPANLAAYVSDEILVAFRPGIRPDTAAQAVGARVHSQIEGLGVHILKVPQGTVEGTLRALEHNPLVEFAEPNGFVYAFANPNDPYANGICYWDSSGQCTTQWAWAKVQGPQAWDLTTGSATVRVAVVDTGIDAGDPYGLPPDPPHEDLGAGSRCNSPTTPVILKSYVSGERGNDDNGHGTHIAGVIGACTNNTWAVAGANWAIQLMGVKVLSWYGSGTWSAVASGIRWAADNGAKVINLSLGGSGGSNTLRRAVDYAWSRGAVLACAAGNSGNSARSYPAFYTNCIAVAATDGNDQKPSWSSYGNWVEVAAPGVAILSTTQDTWEWCFLCWGEGYYEGYDSLSGTSMSTSFVSALAALIWASGKCGTSNSCVRSRIENNADAIAGTGTYWTKGRINFYRALNGP